MVVCIAKARSSFEYGGDAMSLEVLKNSCAPRETQEINVKRIVLAKNRYRSFKFHNNNNKKLEHHQFRSDGLRPISSIKTIEGQYTAAIPFHIPYFQLQLNFLKSAFGNTLQIIAKNILRT